jgi:subtilisin family serine protease
VTTGWPAPPPSPPRRRKGGKGRLVLLALVVVALVGVALAVGAPAGPATADTDPGAAIGSLIGERPIIMPGPSLGDAWTTAPDRASFIALEGGDLVAADQYLVMFGDGAPASAAEAAAKAIDGTIVGHLAYLDTWKIGTAYAAADAETWQNQKAILEAQPGVVSVLPVGLTSTDKAPDCGPGLSDDVYAGDAAKPYDLIGVKAAWDAYYASGLPKHSVHLGMTDTLLTKRPAGKDINWEFDDVTFAEDPPTTGDLREPTKEDPTTDGFHHADGTLGLIAADGGDGGIAGIASPLGSGLVVSFAELGGGAREGAAKAWKSDDGTSYADADLLNTMRQIESGATIITGSWGGNSSAKVVSQAPMWKKFFAKMAVDHPKVLFVYSAGNKNRALDGTNHWPGGIPSPNVITVGNIDTDGTRHSSSNGLDPAVTGGEATLGAPGDKAVWGTGADGAVLASYGGTSSAAPMVTATAALVRAIDPSLTAAEVKELIADSSAIGDLQVGGRTLRTDLAVRKAIDGARAKASLPPLTDEMIAAATKSCSITVSGSITERLENPAGATAWSVSAYVSTMASPTTLSLVAGGARPADWKQPVERPGISATWKVLAPKAGVRIVVTRLDNGFWVTYTLRDDGRPTASPKASPTPTPGATPKPTARPKPTPTPADIGCSGPPPGVEPGTIAYVKWSLKCGGPIAP